MEKKYKFEVDEMDVRLDLFLSSKLSEFSRTVIQNSIKSDAIKVNGEDAKASLKLKIGDLIECSLIDKEANENLIPEDIPLDILFEDSSILIINKPSGLVVHPGNGNKEGTLVNGLIFHCKNLSGLNNSRPGIVHRLDKDTSGVMIVAKTDKAHAFISNQFAEKKVIKTYYALAWGRLDETGIIEGFINRDKFNRTKFKMSKNKGRISKTVYRLEKYFEPISFVKLHPETGRTHQLRVHLSSIGHPIFCDNNYSGGKNRIKSYHVKYVKILKRLFKSINRVALHAGEIQFIHPDTCKEVSFSAPIPDDFNRALDLLRNE